MRIKIELQNIGTARIITISRTITWKLGTLVRPSLAYGLDRLINRTYHLSVALKLCLWSNESKLITTDFIIINFITILAPGTTWN